MSIHETSIVAPGAIIGKNVSIGPYCIIGEGANIGDNTRLHSHVVVDGDVTIGKNNEIYQFSSIGAPPQDLTYKGEPTKVVIGDNNVIREYVSIHRATTKEEGVTLVGSNCLIMAYVHIAHDCIIEDGCILTNLVNMAGHVRIGERSIIGGGTVISQFVSLGRSSYVGGASGINKDIPAFCTAYGNRIRLKGVNIVGMKRQGYSRQVIGEVVDFLRALETSPLSPSAYVEDSELMADYKDNQVIEEIVGNITSSRLGIAPFLS